MKTVAQGGTITLRAFYQDSNGVLTDPQNPRFDIFDPADVEVATDLIPTQESTGVYIDDQDVAIDAAVGVWRSHWTGIINGAPVSGDYFFRVVPEGTVSFEEPSWPTVSELEMFLQEEIPADKIDTAQLLLDLAKGAIQDEVGQVIGLVGSDTIEFFGGSRTELLLPEIPVRDVVSLTEDGTLLAVDDYSWDRAGILRRPSGRWSKPLVIEYSHGYDAVPAAVRAVCLQAAARAYINPTGLPRENLGSYGVSYPQVGFNQGAVIHLTDAEKRMLDPVRP